MKQIRYPAGVHIGDRKVFVPLILGQCLLIASVVVGYVGFLQAILMICGDILIVVLSGVRGVRRRQVAASTRL